ncbi:MAG: hypothetical protein HDS65_06700 [Bacteroidales bacterium]|nr:hypothetical protein [Bacteroidales bacterium]
MATALALLLCGLLILLYSPWSQSIIKEAITNKFNGSDGLEIKLETFRLRFPLKLDLGGVSLVQNGDTMVVARSLSADVALLPLLKGEADITEASLYGAYYKMGSPDSAMYMTIQADTLNLAPVSVGLKDMDIKVKEGRIAGGRVAMTLNPDTTSTSSSEPTKMSIALEKLTLDRFGYTMRMMPTIDTLSAYMAHTTLLDGNIDLLNQKINLKKLAGTGLDAAYIAPDSASIAAFPALPDAASDTVSSAPWTITIDSIGFNHSHALYTTAGVKPLPGLDFSYIEVSDVDLAVRNFYNQATDLRLPVSLRSTERCGVTLAIDGELDIDATALTFKNVNLSTPTGTTAAFSGLMGMGDMATDPTLPLSLQLDGGFAPADLAAMFPTFSLYLNALPTANDIDTDIDVDGTVGHLDIKRLDLQVNRCINLFASGSVENMMNPDKLGADVTLRGNIINVDRLKAAALGAETASSFAIPPMTLNGHVAMNGNNINGNITARTGKGTLALNGRLNGTLESYNAKLDTRSFPLGAFLPDMGLGAMTSTITAQGHGFDFFSPKTKSDVKANIALLEYGGVAYRDINADIALADGHAKADIVSTNKDADFTLSANGNLTGKTYNWHADIDGRNIDLFALKFATEPSSLELTASADAEIGPGKDDIKARLQLNDLFFSQKAGTIALSGVSAHFDASDSSIVATILNRDLAATFTAPEGLTALTSAFSKTSEVLKHQIDNFSINIDSLASAMPPFAFDMHGGSSNLVNDILAPYGMSLRSIVLTADNDSTLAVNGGVRRFDTGSMQLDSLFITATGVDSLLLINAGMLNQPGNMDEWHRVDLKGTVLKNTLSLGIHQENIKGKTGFDFGLRAVADAPDSLFTLSVNPFKPVIGYQQWSVNTDNYITYHIPDKHIDANLHMEGGNSSLAIYTEHQGAEENGEHAHYGAQEDLVIRIGDIHISDWISFNPFAPPIKGDVNADVRLNTIDNRIVGKGSASITDFFYGREKVADFKADFDVSAQSDGTLRAKADLFANGQKTITIAGALNDSTAVSPLALDFSMIRFPLSTANPFLPAGTAKLSGVLNGNLKISGTESAPIYNGTFDFDSTAVELALTGTPYKFSDNPIDVTNSVVQFRDFAISGCNDNPLKVNGTVDLTDMADLKMNLSLKANNMMLVNNNRARKGADVYGKAYVSLDANAHGSMSFMVVNADLKLLSGTNVTYVLTDAASTLTGPTDQNMVKFVNFTDSLAVVKADSLTTSGLAMMLDAMLTIEEGTTINVDLSTDGKNKAQVQSNGTLQFSMTPLDDGRLTGRLNINEGFVRYTPPFMSEKNFSFDDGSYVAFNGDMMNPTLNIHMTDVLKANVTQSGQDSRLVNFDVKLGVTGTLADMNVVFDLATNDDMTVANELESMSAEQRANQAMNLLLYNVYTGPGTKGDASLSGNPLYSFLESQLNSWAANTIKGVDISFGIDQYDKTVGGSTSSTMSYSYQVSKSLFNDRFKIVVGGNYSTDADADENFSQNLISDISFEYFLNPQRSMYLRLFRHTGYESILEGEITQTGVGFVYRRKLRRIGDMFISPAQARRRDERENQRLLEEDKNVEPENEESK